MNNNTNTQTQTFLSAPTQCQTLIDAVASITPDDREGPAIIALAKAPACVGVSYNTLVTLWSNSKDFQVIMSQH